MNCAVLGLWLLSSLVPDGVVPAEQGMQLVEVRRIWDEGAHNAFTDLIRFKGHWYCSFREGAGHAKGAGTIRVLTSSDGTKWISSALIEAHGVDLRDPKLSLTPDGQLMIVAGAAVPPSRDPLTDHYSVVSFSPDGKAWTTPQRDMEGWHWLWRVTWHKGKGYGVAYRWDPKERSRGSAGTLFQSANGRQFTKVTDFQIANPTEATLAFDGDTLHCLQRRDGSPNTAMLGSSKPPYSEWQWKDLGRYFGGPNLIRLPDGSWWACGRLMEQGKAQTALCRLDVKAGTLKPVLMLPSGGDTSYPGLVWHENQLWISYYSSHEGKTSIYLARVRPVVRQSAIDG